MSSFRGEVKPIPSRETRSFFENPFFKLPYYKAKMSSQKEGKNHIYSSFRSASTDISRFQFTPQESLPVLAVNSTGVDVEIYGLRK